MSAFSRSLRLAPALSLLVASAVAGEETGAPDRPGAGEAPPFFAGVGGFVAPGLRLGYAPAREEDGEDAIGGPVIFFENGLGLATTGSIDTEEDEYGGALHIYLAF